MATSPGSSSSNPRKFSEKIALHNQKQAEETRAFDELMTDLTMSRVQFQKLQQLRLAQSRAQYYGGSLPNVNQISSSSAEFQPSVNPTDNIRGMRHHGLVERVSRSRLHPSHHRPVEKHGRPCDGSPYASVYLSPPSDNSWRRTNSDSALHTSTLSTKSQDPFVEGNQSALRDSRPSQRNAGFHDVGGDSYGEAFSFPASLNEDGMLNISKPLPKQLWEAKKVQSLSSRPRSCEMPGITVCPSPEQSPGLTHFQGNLNTGGSLPDLTNLHFPSPLPTPLDPDDVSYSNISGENSTSNLPAAMTHLGISNSPGVQSTCSNSSVHTGLNTSMSSLQSHGQSSPHSNPAFHPSLRLASLSNPSLSTSALSVSPRRRQTPVSPLTLTPGMESQRGLSRQLSPTSPQSMSTNSQASSTDRSPLSLPPLEPPPPYPLYQEQSQQARQSQQKEELQESYGYHHQPLSPVACPNLDLNLATTSLASFFGDTLFDQQSPRHGKYMYQQDQYDMLGSPNSFLQSNSSFYDPNMNLQYSQIAMMGFGGSQGNLQESLQLRPSFLYSNCGGSVPNIILTDDSNASLPKDLSNALAGVSEMGFDADNSFQLDDELKIEPLSLDGLSMLSDPDMVLPDPSIEDTFRSDRL
ncbi:CREB-regulated transcription coactivator 3 isoform X3 [Pleurodeles waltl]|uniref:CREB-regulated transcription coactivator 3 isoform X3 n=1 Tax=Pleurodeles waltl TaxID=8319 RepID=UPI0037095F29